MKPLRICFLIRRLNEGGAQRQLLALARGLNPERFEVTVLTFYPGGIFWDAFTAVPGLRLECLHKRGRMDNLLFLWRLVRRLRSLRPRILHGYLLGGNLFAAAVRPFFPGLCIVWGLRNADVASQAKAGFDIRLRGLERLASRLSHCMVVNSKAGMAHYEGLGFSRKKLCLIPNGLDTGRFSPNPAYRLRAREEWSIADGDLVIGIVGRLAPAKDHPTFLAAAARFLALRPRCRVVVIGGGPDAYVRHLETVAEDIAGSITWAGSRNDVENLYPAFDLLVSSSLVEGFPNAIAEAMACGVPVVATDVGDASYIVGDTGIIVQPGHADAMAKAWEDMLPRLGSSLSQRARSRIAEEFGVERLIMRTEALFHSLSGVPL